ncbi:MAG: aspartate aminotransferase family protein [Candidatus Xenobium sp.]|jgi:putrescine aminotransferase|nr:aminotransferase class III-fold pyridoxal phosphate-dependent enzyme [Burkholderiales bacterium]
MSTGKQAVHEITRLYRDYVNPDLARVIRISGLGTLEDQAEGSRVWDHEGVEYLDMAGGYGMFSLGHRHPEVVQAVADQLYKMPMSAKVFLNPVMARLAAALAEIAPGDLQYSFFCNSGTEAVEGALKLARLATGRTNFVATHGAFHGKSTGGLAVSGRPGYREPFQPLMPGVKHVPFGDLKALDQVVDSDTAGVILEPIQGEGGIHLAPDGYLQGVREICTRKKALMVADEVQTGLGRTGRMFAVQHWEVEPDLLVLAKALGGGVMPIGAILGTPEVWKAFRGRPLIHTSTFGGSPLACAAGLATLQVLRKDRLPERAATEGAWFLDRLRELVARNPDICAEARGLGLMLGLELTEERFGGSIISEMARRRVIAVYTLNQPRVIRFEPPLTVSRQDLELALEALEASILRTRETFSLSTNSAQEA